MHASIDNSEVSGSGRPKNTRSRVDVLVMRYRACRGYNIRCKLLDFCDIVGLPDGSVTCDLRIPAKDSLLDLWTLKSFVEYIQNIVDQFSSPDLIDLCGLLLGVLACHLSSLDSVDLQCQELINVILAKISPLLVAASTSSTHLDRLLRFCKNCCASQSADRFEELCNLQIPKLELTQTLWSLVSRHLCTLPSIELNSFLALVRRTAVVAAEMCDEIRSSTTACTEEGTKVTKEAVSSDLTVLAVRQVHQVTSARLFDHCLLMIGLQTGYLQMLDTVSDSLCSTEIAQSHSGAVYDVQRVPTDDGGSFALSCGRDGSVRLYEQQQPDRLNLRVLYELHLQAVCALALCPTQRQWFLTCSVDTTARLADLSRNYALRVFVGHEAAVNTVDFAVDNCVVASGSSDGTVRIWDVRQADCIRVVKATGPVTQVRFEGDGLLLCDENGLLQQYSVKASKVQLSTRLDRPIQRLICVDDSITTLSFCERCITVLKKTDFSKVGECRLDKKYRAINLCKNDDFIGVIAGV